MVGDRIASDIEGGRRAGLETSWSSAAPARARRPRRRAPPDHVLETSPGCCGERRRAQTASAPGVAFAGVFAVTFCGLVAVGAVLPVLPRYVTARSTPATSRSAS